MSILGALKRERRALTESEWLLKALGGNVSITGRQVGASDALRISAVYACVRIIAETIASLPLVTYRRLERGKERNPRHRLYRLLHDLPNPEMTALELREALTGHAVLRGVAYANIQRDNQGQVTALWPLRPDRMTAFRDPATSAPRYLYTLPSGEQVRLEQQDLLRLRNFGSGDDLNGYSTISLFRETYGLALAAEEYGARFFANDSRPGGVLEVRGKLKDPERLKESWENAHRSMTDAWRVAILEEGVTWKQIAIPPRDAEFLGLRKFQISEIARIFRVPLHMIAELDRATFSNIEHQAIEFVVHTIRPWAVRWEQAIARDLWPGQVGEQTHFSEHVLDGLLRGDALARAQALAIQRQNGALTANEWREIENRNPLPGGDELLVNGNMLPAGQVGRPEAGAEGP
jgi:HK97 family phage portal protein